MSGLAGRAAGGEGAASIAWTYCSTVTARLASSTARVSSPAAPAASAARLTQTRASLRSPRAQSAVAVWRPQTTSSSSLGWVSGRTGVSSPIGWNVPITTRGRTKNPSPYIFRELNPASVPPSGPNLRSRHETRFGTVVGERRNFATIDVGKEKTRACEVSDFQAAPSPDRILRWSQTPVGRSLDRLD